MPRMTPPTRGVESLERRWMLASPETDVTFGEGGVARVDDPLGDEVALVEELPDGKFLAIGNSFGKYGLVARFNADGTADTSFDGDGKLTTPADGGPFFHGAIAPDKKIVLMSDTGNQAVFFRFNPDGTFDNSFGAGGEVSHAGVVIARTVAVQGDGKIVFAYESGQGFLSRLNADGSVDDSF